MDLLQVADKSLKKRTSVEFLENFLYLSRASLGAYIINRSRGPSQNYFFSQNCSFQIVNSKKAKREKSTKMDPFEARLTFIKSLQKLNGSIQANDTAVQFLLRNVDLREDLYSCILQQLDRVSYTPRKLETTNG